MDNDLKLKPKVKAFADKLIADPKISHTQAYLDTHQTTNRAAANVQATKTLAKPSVKIYLQRHANRAKERMLELVESEKEDIALRASVDILDRTYGKAVTKQQSENVNLNVNVEASQELAAGFADYLAKTTSQS